MALQFRRGTDAERQQFEFAEGEPVYVTDTGELYIGDGETQGGRRVLSSLSEESDPELGGNLDLNDNNIVGIGDINIDGNLSVSGLGQSLDLNDYNIIGRGSINIDGTITATGNINLGDGAEDNVIVGGQISSPLTPAEDGLYDLGSDSLRWRNGFFEGVDITGEISVDTISVARIIDQDSSVLYDSATNTFTANFEGDGSRLDLSNLDSSIVPNFDNFYDLGSDSLRWRNGYFEGLEVDGEITAGSIAVDTIYTTDSTILWDAATDTINVSTILADSIQGDVIGSVFGDNSSVLVDANDNSLHTDELEIRSNSILLTDGFELIFDKTKSALAVWEEVDSEVTNAPRFATRASRTSGGSITSVTSNDVVAANIGTMFDGQDFVLASAFATTVDQQTGTNTLPTRLDIFLAGAEGQQLSAFRVNSRGTASASVFKTGSYEDEDERDSLIPSPEPGMIILLTGHNDSTGVPKFQGYDGTQWIDFT